MTSDEVIEGYVYVEFEIDFELLHWAMHQEEDFNDLVIRALAAARERQNSM
jgi:hypothetical protein